MIVILKHADIVYIYFGAYIHLWFKNAVVGTHIELLSGLSVLDRQIVGFVSLLIREKRL